MRTLRFSKRPGDRLPAAALFSRERERCGGEDAQTCGLDRLVLDSEKQGLTLVSELGTTQQSPQNYQDVYLCSSLVSLKKQGLLKGTFQGGHTVS